MASGAAPLRGLSEMTPSFAESSQKSQSLTPPVEKATSTGFWK